MGDQREDRLTPSGRRVAPGGWRRALVGGLVGLGVGLLAVLGLRDGHLGDGPDR